MEKGLRIDLSGQKILVTGGSRGIGAAIVQTLGQAGATLAVHYHRNAAPAEALAREAGGGSCAIAADLRSPDAAERLFTDALDRLGGLDVLVNNAGVAIKSPPAAPGAAWLADWQATLAVNLTAAAILSRRAVARFAANGGGRIIHIASRAAFRGDTPDYLAYAASKGGMVALSRSIARGYGKQGVKSFVVAPGFVRTDMAADFLEAYGEDYATFDLALPTLTEPKDLGPTVALLASGLADHATGCTIDINAGSYVH